MFYKIPSMKPVTKTILKSFDKAYKIQPISRPEIETFKANYIKLIDRVEESEQNNESEENFKGHLMDFLKNTYFQKNNLVAPKGKTDFVIHTTSDGSSPAAILFEVKRPKNTTEMVSRENLNTKAMQELMLYYFEERSKHQNNDITHLIITNIHEWFIFESNTFERLFYKNSKLLKDFKDWKDGKKVSRNNDLFYNEIAKPALNAIEESIEFTYFDIRTYEKNIRNTDLDDDKRLIELYKVFSPTHLLKLQATNDNNKLNSKFYTELLHIIGLEEVKEGGKKLIQRKEKGKRDEGSLLENCINILESEDRLHHVKELLSYGKEKDEQKFNIGLELCITWINRILFLKLLEAQLQKYHNNDPKYRFLNSPTIQDFDVLNKLFFQVLAKPIKDRSESIQAQFSQIPYLNSSLFDISTLEDDTIRINSLDDSLNLSLLSNSVLRKNASLKDKKQVNTLDYLFGFLDAYDFASENKEDIVEENRELISASVLGLIFEKINGYRDGSFYTPAFITEYMCKETITKAVIQKFNETKDWNCTTLTDLHNKIDNIKEANQIFDSLHICDPAVGSGHFLVSALNALIFIKAEIGILQDRNGKRLKGYTVEVINDELIVLDEEEKVFEYKVLTNGKVNTEIQRVQETLFHEKQTLIENCLFGVDINPNSVKICRLRLWIELLKNAYYTSESAFSELETLPNIDINIKQGNSLLSRYALNEDLSDVFQKQKFSLKTYRDAVQAYKDSKSKDAKAKLLQFINEIKEQFKETVYLKDPRRKKLTALKEKRLLLDYNVDMFGNVKIDKDQADLQKRKLDADIKKTEVDIADIEQNNLYKGSFEWRFEFPEVLDDKGIFVGFDVVIGNPPYIRQEEIKDQKANLKNNYKTYSGAADLYVFFVEKAFTILKNDGNFSYIIPNKWMQTGYGQPLRAFLLQKQLLNIIDFGDLQVFDEATTYPCILEIANSEPSNAFNSTVLKTLDFGEDFARFSKKQSNKIEIKNLSDETWILSNSADQKILTKLKENCVSLSEYVGGSSFRGILTGLTEAFVIDEETKNKIIEQDEKSREIIKPVLRGRDIKPYYAQSTGMWLISTFPTLKLNIENYQGVKNYLLDFGLNRLEQSGKSNSRKKTTNKWFETQDNIGYWQEFEKPKIMYQVMQVKPCFIYDENGLYCNNSMWIIPKDDKVLLAILNSKMGWWLISKYCTAIQNGFQLIWNYFGQILIPQANEAQTKKIIAKVEQILAVKNRSVEPFDPATDTSQLESEIDAMVYELYGLTAEEIAIVEGK